MKTKFENRENEFIIFNFLYMNQKKIKAIFLVFRVKLKTRDFLDWVKLKTRDFLNSNLRFKRIFIVFINFIFKKMVLQNGFSYSLFSTKFKYETCFLKMKTKD